MIQIGTISSKRQLTIPSRVFRKANLSTGDKVIIQEKDGELIIKKTADLVDQLAGSVSVPQNLMGRDVEESLKSAKERYFSRNKK